MHNRSKEIAILIGIIVLTVIAVFVPIYTSKRNQDLRNSASSIPKQIYAVGDSITFGHRDCKNGIECQLEPDTYLSNYANTKSTIDKKQYQYTNLGYSGTGIQGLFPNASFQNAYKANSLSAFQNQSIIQKPDSIINKREGGEIRANQGEFDSIRNSIFIMAYGRNDVKRNSNVESFKSSYEKLLQRINSSNERIIMTIPPMSYEGWKQYSPSSIQSPYQYAIDIPEYAIELDTFYSAQLWELAFKYSTKIVPVHEHLLLTPQEQLNYFSSDQIHPSKAGHKIISNLLTNESNTVKRQDISSLISKNKLFTIKGNPLKKTYGQIVYYDKGKFLASTPIMINPGQSYTIENIGSQTILYTTQAVNISKINDNASPKIYLRQQITPLNDRFAITVQGLSSISSPTIKFYIGSKDPSKYCTSSTHWKEVKGKFYGNTFLADISTKTLVGNGGNYVVIMNYGIGTKTITGNPAGNCGLTQFTSNSDLNSELIVVK